MHLKKRIFSLALSLVMSIALCGTTLAAGITPRWNNIWKCVPELSFSGTTANCTVTIRGESGTTEIDPMITLQKENASGGFSADTSWEPSAASGSSFTWSGTRRNCVSGTDYRLKVVADVTRNGTTETITVYSDPLTCP